MKRVLGVVLAALLLTGCGTAARTTNQPLATITPKVMATVAAEAAPATAATTSPMGFLRPSPGQSTVLAAAFVAIDPRMDNADRYVTRAVDQCDYVRKSEITGAALVASTKERFSGGSIPDLTDAQAQQILDAITSTFCH